MSPGPLFGATLAGSFASGLTIAQTLMSVAPVVTIVWFLAQEATTRVQAQTSRIMRFLFLLAPSAPGMARSAVALGLSGYIGSALGQSLPVAALTNFLDPGDMPGWLFLAILPLLISIGGQVALSPILLVVLLGEALKGVPTLPTGDTQIVFALSVGWALSMSASPNATATLLISSTCRIPPTTLTWVWNLRYAVICYGAAVAVFTIVA